MPFATRALILATILSGSAFSSHALATDATFVSVAREFTNNVGLLDVTVSAAISADAKVAFVAGYQTSDPAAPKRIFTVDTGVTNSVDLDAGGFGLVRNVQVNSSGNVVFLSNHFSAIPSPQTYRGVYSTTTAAAPITTILERPTSASFPDEGGPQYNIDLTEGNKIAFSTIINATGAIYRGTLGGPLEVLRTGTGTFYNTKEVATNESGTVAVQMEHVRAFGGLGRGILAFDTPTTGAEPATIARTAIEQGSVGIQPAPVMNNLGQVAFSLDFAQTMTFYTPPNDFGGTVLTTQTLQPGVYVITPNEYGVPKTITTIADNTGPYDSFGRVQINDAGLVVFEASTDGPGGVFGIFTGDDPVADKVVAMGDVVQGRLFSALYLGELNNAGQFTFMTSDFNTTDREVWIASIGAIPEPASVGIMAIGAAALLTRRRRSN
jgi:hypothetical protein